MDRSQRGKSINSPIIESDRSHGARISWDHNNVNIDSCKGRSQSPRIECAQNQDNQVSINKGSNVVETSHELCLEFISLKQFDLMFDLSPQDADKAFSVTRSDD
jgi:hypothetical protein